MNKKSRLLICAAIFGMTLPAIAESYDPNCLLASFTTTKGQQNGVLFVESENDSDMIFIDWSGSGSYQSYTILKATESTEAQNTFSFTTSANAKVKIYGRDANTAIKVFSISGANLNKVDLSGLSDLTCLTLSKCTLKEGSVLSWPASAASLTELYLDKNQYTSFDCSPFPSLHHFSLANNSLTSLDISMLPALETVTLSTNKLASLNLNNPNLWSLDVSSNKLTQLNVNGLNSLSQLNATNNQLSSFDLDALYAIEPLTVLQINENSFTFATLPEKQDSWNLYDYASQAKIDVTPAGNIVDLSAQAERNGSETNFLWFSDTPSINLWTWDGVPEVSGPELEAGTQYVTEGGVTSFLETLPKVIGVMLNSLFPKVYLQTNPFAITYTGVEEISCEATATREVYNLQGMKVRGDFESLPAGVYVINGKKVVK